MLMNIWKTGILKKKTQEIILMAGICLMRAICVTRDGMIVRFASEVHIGHMISTIEPMLLKDAPLPAASMAELGVIRAAEMAGNNFSKPS